MIKRKPKSLTDKAHYAIAGLSWTDIEMWQRARMVKAYMNGFKAAKREAKKDEGR